MPLVTKGLLFGLFADMCLHCRLLHCDSQCRPHLQLLSCGHSACGEADVSDAWAQLPTGHPRQAWHVVLATWDGGWVHRTSPLRCQLCHIRFRPSSHPRKSLQLLLVHSSGSKIHRRLYGRFWFINLRYYLIYSSTYCSTVFHLCMAFKNWHQHPRFGCSLLVQLSSIPLTK